MLILVIFFFHFINYGYFLPSNPIPIYIEEKLNGGRELYDKHATPTQDLGKKIFYLRIRPKNVMQLLIM